MIKNVDQLPVTGQRVFVRVDFNVPRDRGGGKTVPKITDDTRIREALPTIQYLMDSRAKIILASHLGRPKGREASESLVAVAERLAELIGREVLFPEDCVGDAVRKLAHELREGQVMLLENLRFHKEEEANDPQFSQSLAQLADVYVSDAFGTLHRAHASTACMVKHFKEKGIGLLVKKELEFLTPLLTRPARPSIAVLGGAKVSDKIGLIENMIPKVDGLVLGGGLAYTFLKAQGIEIGNSKFEPDCINVAKRILTKAKEAGVPVSLPTDHRVAHSLAADAPSRVVKTISDGEMGLDIGPQTIENFRNVIAQAKTIFWNGPMGVFELPAFAEGSIAVAKAIASTDAVSIVGGGESLAAVQMSGVADDITHLSTGGGATLEFLEGKELPGLKALELRGSMRKTTIVGNWKMNGTIEESLKMITELRHKLPEGSPEVVVAPPSTALYSAHVALQDTPIKLAGQNMHWENEGAFTGEISGYFLKDVGCSHVLIGHSERRQFFGETDESVNKKITAALALELTPIFCLGETLEQRNAGKTETVIEAQLKRGLQSLPMSDIKSIIVAYEPVWAIGTGKTPTTEEISAALGFIRNLVGKLYDGPTANALPILYGGSVSPANAKEILQVKDVDGLLVGGASLVTEKFLKIIAARESERGE